MAYRANITIKSNIQPFFKAEKPCQDADFIASLKHPSVLEQIPESKLSQTQIILREGGRLCPLSGSPRCGISGIIYKKGNFYEVTRCAKISDCEWAERNKCGNETLLKNFP